MSEPMMIGPGPRCRECGEDYGQHTEQCSVGKKIGKMVGTEVNILDVLIENRNFKAALAKHAAREARIKRVKDAVKGRDDILSIPDHGREIDAAMLEIVSAARELAQGEKERI